MVLAYSVLLSKFLLDSKGCLKYYVSFLGLYSTYFYDSQWKSNTVSWIKGLVMINYFEQYFHDIILVLYVLLIIWDMLKFSNYIQNLDYVQTVKVICNVIILPYIPNHESVYFACFI